MLACGLGVLTYALYLDKEVALAFPVVLLLYTLAECVYPLSPEPRRQKLYALVSYLAGFAVPFLLMKATLFRGMGNSYNQQSIDVLFLPGRFTYMIYSFVYYMGNVLVAFCVLPVVLPLVTYRRLPASEKRLVRLLVLLFVVISSVIAYTISVRQDFDLLVPCTHLRYISFLFLPFLALLQPCVWLIRERGVPRRLLLAAVFLCLLLPFYNGIKEGSHVDEMMMSHIRFLTSSLDSMVSVRLVLGAVLIAFCLLLVCKPKLFLPLFCVGLCLVQIGDNRMKMNTLLTTNSFHINETSYEEIDGLRGLMAEHPDEQFLLINNNTYSHSTSIDTFLNLPNLCEVNMNAINAVTIDGNVDLTAKTIPVDRIATNYTDLNVRYLILPTALSPVTDCGEPVMTLEANAHYVYRLDTINRFTSIGSSCAHIGGSLILPLAAPVYSTNQDQDEIGFISTEKKGFLAFGPYMYIPAGEYRLVFRYDTSGCTEPAGTVVGQVDANAPALKDAPVQADFTVDSDAVTLESVVLLEPAERFEARIYTTAAGIRPISVEITRIG